MPRFFGGFQPGRAIESSHRRKPVEQGLSQYVESRQGRLNTPIAQSSLTGLQRTFIDSPQACACGYYQTPFGLRSVAVLAVVLCFVVVRFAAAQAPEVPVTPEAYAANVRVLEAVVNQVKGNVTWRASEDAAWQAAEVNQRLQQGAEIRTALNSQVLLRLPPDQIVAVDRLSRVKLIQAFFDEAKAKYQTDLGMEYGRVRYDVQTGGIEHEATIYSPNATLAVRGTDAQLDDMPGYVPRITSYHGRIVSTLDGKTVVMGGTTKVTATGRRPTPANTELGETHIDPTAEFAGRTESEFLLIEDFPAIGGFDPVLQTVLAERTLGFEFANVFVGTVRPEESLFILLGFVGVPFVTNVNLVVIDPENNVISPSMPQSPSGGFHTGDSFADNDEGVIEESVTFPLVVPKGTYRIRAELVPQVNFPDDGAAGAIQVVGNNVPIRSFVPIFLSPSQPVFEAQLPINELLELPGGNPLGN